MKYYGIYPCFVTTNKDPDKRGRVRVKCPLILNDKETTWCEPCYPNAIDNGGDIFIPPKGEAVWVMFIEGDVNKPVYLGGWWSTEKTPFGKNYVTNERIISYANTRISLKNNSIDIKVGDNEDSTHLIITNNKVKVIGNLEVTGRIIN